MTAPSEPTAPLVVPPTLPKWEERYVDVYGHRTRYFQFGDGPPLLLIPSAFLRAPSYRSTIAALAETFRVTVAEMPGSGRSECLNHPWGFEHGADWAAELLDALGLRRSIVVGHSDTGGDAAMMGVRHPDRIDMLVLVNSVGARPGAGWAKLAWGRFLDGTFEETRLNLPLGLHTMAGLLHHPKNWLDHAFALAPADTTLEVAPKIAAPTLVAWGRRDHTFPPDCAERLAAAIPDARVAWSEGSHDFLITRPHDLARPVVALAHELGLLPAGS